VIPDSKSAPEQAAPPRQPQSLELAARVIARADKANPADLMLRETFRKMPGLTRALTREVSLTVFAYYRWFGWLDHRRPVTARLKRAIDLAAGYLERPESFSDEKLIARTLPSWITSEIDLNVAWIRSLQAEPRLWLRARPGKAKDLARALTHARACALPDAVRYVGNEDIFRRPEFQHGECEIQDVSSQAVGVLCDPQPGETWWDACAGEGGKTLHLSDLMGNRGLIWATDRADWRLRRLKARAARARCFNFRSAPWDGSARLPTKTRFDGVLVDAPCSGTGTWQRNPHARWTTTTQDVRELADIQKKLLLNVAGSLKPGGKLIYAVCSLTRSETDQVADDVDARSTGLEPLPLPNPFDAEAQPSSRLWLWPQFTAGNGMFVAAWRRK
jgi:16S rRNA (cytosine967-C5)-methyltransferase